MPLCLVDGQQNLAILLAGLRVWSAQGGPNTTTISSPNERLEKGNQKTGATDCFSAQHVGLGEPQSCQLASNCGNVHRAGASAKC